MDARIAELEADIRIMKSNFDCQTFRLKSELEQQERHFRALQTQMNYHGEFIDNAKLAVKMVVGLMAYAVILVLL